MMDGRAKLADAMMTAGSYGPAAQVLAQHLNGHPEDPDALYLYGTALYRTNNFPLAAEVFARLAMMRPHDARAHYSVGITMIKLGRIDAARTALESALRADPDFGAARTKLTELASAPASSQPSSPSQTPEQVNAERLVAGKQLVTGGRALSSFLDRYVFAALFGAVGLLIVMRRPTAGLRGIAEFFFFLTPGRTPSDLRDQLEFMEKNGASESQLQAVRAELAEAEAALEVTIDGLATVVQVAGGILAVLAVLVTVHALLLARSTRYQIFESRIDIREGVLTQRLDSVWLYQLADVYFEQPLWLALTGHARLKLRTNKVNLRGRPVIRSITAMVHTQPAVQERPAKFLQKMFHELRDRALVEGLAIKKFWVE
jgi:tetratricopeptide (TPR) repeat protein